MSQRKESSEEVIQKHVQSKVEGKIGQVLLEFEMYHSCEDGLINNSSKDNDMLIKEVLDLKKAFISLFGGEGKSTLFPS